MNNGNVEFPSDDGSFQLMNFPDKTRFTVTTGEDQSTSASISSFYPAVPQVAATSSSQTPQSQRRPLATVKIVRADIGTSGKPSNIIVHNLNIFVNIYSEHQANIGYISQKVREEMGDDELILVGPNGLVYYDQEGTRGKQLIK